MTLNTPDNCNYLLGIDGGGSNCRARLTDLDGRILGEGLSGSANVFQNGEKAWNSVIDSVDQALANASLPFDAMSQTQVVAGLAGAEVTHAANQFLERVSGFYDFKLLNDGQIACLGAHSGNEGTVLIIGTGIIGFSYSNNEWHRVSGWGFPLADEGSGAWLGMQAVKAALNQYDGINEESELSKDIWKSFPEGVYQLLAWSQTAKSGDYGKFSPNVVSAFKKNDPIAIDIVNRQMSSVNAQLKALHKENRPLCIMGGLAQWVEEKLPSSIKSHLVQAQGDALDGALILAKNLYLEKQQTSNKSTFAKKRTNT